MKTVEIDKLENGHTVFTGDRVAVVSPAIGGFRVWGYETVSNYMEGESHNCSNAVPYLTALALAEGYSSDAFDLCAHCCEPVSWVEDGNNSAWVHLTPAPECFLSRNWEGVGVEVPKLCEACAMLEDDRDMTAEQARTANLCGDCQAYFGIGGN